LIIETLLKKEARRNDIALIPGNMDKDCCIAESMSQRFAFGMVID
jgi:hypothetical protein